MRMKSVIIFASGLAIGGLAGFIGAKKYLDKKYDEVVSNELQALKEKYEKESEVIISERELTPEEVAEIVKDEKPTVEEAKTILREYGNMEDEDVDDYFEEEEEEERVYHVDRMKEYEKPVMHDKPYLIPEDVFGDDRSYEQFFFTMYADGVITDLKDMPVEDVDRLFGAENLKHFGDPEYGYDNNPDYIYIRSDDWMDEYEIAYEGSLSYNKDVAPNSAYRLVE